MNFYHDLDYDFNQLSPYIHNMLLEEQGIVVNCECYRIGGELFKKNVIDFDCMLQHQLFS